MLATSPGGAQFNERGKVHLTRLITSPTTHDEALLCRNSGVHDRLYFCITAWHREL